jgi:uncharacterized membrane protein
MEGTMRISLLLNLWMFSICAMFLSVPPAAAQLTICNKTGYPADVAVGYQSGDDWQSKGWYQIDGGHCTEVISGDLTQRYYYFYAFRTQGPGMIWHGDYWLCVSQDSFTIVGATERCTERGYQKKGFIQIDTGDYKSFTQGLSD